MNVKLYTQLYRTYLFFILCIAFHIVRMQTIFCRRCPHHVKGSAGLTKPLIQRTPHWLTECEADDSHPSGVGLKNK
jgi:hypothetical protein